MLFKAEVATLADDDVILDRNSDNLARFYETFSDSDILFARIGNTAWVIVYGYR